MNRKQPIAEFDGPTLNGHPILGAAEVQVWFRSAQCNASVDAAASIAQMLNDCELFGFLWKNTLALRERRRKNASRLRHVRIAIALKTLQSDLPLIMEDTLKVYPQGQSAVLEPIATLLEQVNEISPRFQAFLPGRGRDVERWHIIAQNVGAKIVETIRISSGRRVGFAKPTSPAVKILQSALAHLGVTTTPEAIVDAMRAKRARSRKILGK